MRNSTVGAELKALADPKKAKGMAKYFKTGKGEYGAGDRFIGVTVPQMRAVARRNSVAATLGEVAALLDSPIHEYRATALEILDMKYASAATPRERTVLKNFYLLHLDRINNWDLVDGSVRDILGAWLYERKHGTEMALLRKLAKSKTVWHRRMAIIATYYHIARNEFGPTLAVAELLLDDSHDLMHKAVGWMLRETGKRSLAAEERFLKAHAAAMPRTALRYAIERFPKAKKAYYMSMKRKAAPKNR